MENDNVTKLDAYRVAQVIFDYWMDCYSDNGAIYEKAQRNLDALKAVCPPEVWDKALVIAHNRWGQS